MFFNKHITDLDRSDFIESGRKEASYFQWLNSRGTNYTCYEQFRNSLSEESIINSRVEIFRIFVYALQRPITFTYFYWTVLVFIIHKFNFKKPAMKLILYHFILRVLGNVLDKLGDFYKYYFSNENVYDGGILVKTSCVNNSIHPFKWFLTRQICTILWYVGEIIGDWYPLLRTRAVLRNDKSIWFVYITCGLFNLSKVYLIFIYLSYSPKSLYNKDGAYDRVVANRFYNIYNILQLVITYTSFLYDISVYFVLKNGIFIKNKEQYNVGFLKKFKNLSEYRMLVSALVSAIFLPFISLSILFKFYYQKTRNLYELDFSFEETRKMVANVQYYMIFIDQILLICYQKNSQSDKYIHSKNGSSNYYNSKSNSSYYNYNNSNSLNRSVLKNSNSNLQSTNFNTTLSGGHSTLSREDDTLKYENNEFKTFNLNINDFKSYNSSNNLYNNSNNNNNNSNNGFISNYKNEYNLNHYFNHNNNNYQKIFNNN